MADFSEPLTNPLWFEKQNWQEPKNFVRYSQVFLMKTDLIYNNTH